jgi:UDP-N-acetylglucosamine:LPS N-acetylglucosamine transferase
MKRTVLIMAGGTGGHVFPALAAARVLRERGYEPVWLGTQRGLEAKLVPPQHIEIEWISVSGLRGKGFATWLAAPFKLSLAIWQSLQVMRRRRPNVVLGAGGFVSGPGGVAAWLTRRPLVIHEQNAVAGMTNRMLSRLARRVLELFPQASRRVRVLSAWAIRCDARSHRSPRRPSASRAGADRSACSCSAAARARRGSMQSCRLRSRRSTARRDR